MKLHKEHWQHSAIAGLQRGEEGAGGGGDEGMCLAWVTGSLEDRVAPGFLTGPHLLSAALPW